MTKRDNIAIANQAASLLRSAIPEIKRVWLFGSQARGEATAESDFDLLFTVDENKKPFVYDGKGRAALYPLTVKYGVAFDVFSATDKDMRKDNTNLASIYQTILAEGVLI